jgi:2-polyprenyl-3-methyl-5-hydroxy-6-metoxy-1,4-benzoquinol methylase
LTRSCPICSSSARDTLYVTPTGQRVNCCSSCGMIYSDNSAPVDYASSSIYTSTETYDGQPAHYRRIVRNLLEHGISTRSAVLDVGCATGGLLEALQECSFRNVLGVSLSAGEVATCLAKNLRAEQADITSPDSPDWSRAAFDVVLLSHVLEHIPSPLPFLLALRRLVSLSPLGFLYIEVPNALRYSQHFTSLCQGFNQEHINHFSLSYLTQLANRADLEVYAQGSYDMPVGFNKLYPAVWVLLRPGHPTLRSAIESYRDRLTGQMDRVLTHLNEQLASYRDSDGDSDGGAIAIWGTGQTSHLLLEGTSLPVLSSFTLVAATDTNPIFHGQLIRGCKIVPPVDFHPPASVPILVCSQISRAVILERIKELGLTNSILTLEAE